MKEFNQEKDVRKISVFLDEIMCLEKFIRGEK